MWSLATDVAWCVSLSVCHNSDPCKYSWIDWDAILVVDSVGEGEFFFWGGACSAPLKSIVRVCGELLKSCWPVRHAVWSKDLGGPKKPGFMWSDSVMGMGNFGGYFPLKCIIMCKQQTSTCTQGTSQCGESEASGWIHPMRVWQVGVAVWPFVKICSLRVHTFCLSV